MANQAILNNHQIKLLEIISGNDSICREFYLTGGTALAEYYLHHRHSEDLDFFSESEVAPEAIITFFRTHKKSLRFVKIDSQQSFNRNLFFVHYGDKQVVKLEFTYFPFPRIEKKKKRAKLFIDSLLDIAVNKVFTIYQNPRSRDFIDLYLILQSQKYKLADLIKKAKVKFDWHVDPLRLAAQFEKVTTVKDYPRMIIELEPVKWQNFFLREATKLEKQILQ